MSFDPTDNDLFVRSLATAGEVGGLAYAANSSVRVLAAAYRITGNQEDAQDVLQTVFLRLVRREGGAWLSDSPGAYLHRAAINAALDIVRSRKSARATALDDVEPTLPADPVNSPERQQGGSEIRDHLRVALAKLNPKTAEVVTLR